MTSLSLRIPDDLVARLEQEAAREQRGRSEIVRDALDRYLAEKERQRFMADIVREAQAVYGDPAARAESLELAEQFLEAEDEVGPGSAVGADLPPEQWWRK